MLVLFIVFHKSWEYGRALMWKTFDRLIVYGELKGIDRKEALRLVQKVSIC